ncbi:MULTISPECIES: hypothetical protein [Staphylococcus]|uniref:hypothetical protein n=1 Tax=Staphylococcus TaxID=1279 RepID=UPI000736150D|nr:MULTISPECIES: hypothetical protein [Staphylococcus]KTW08577.1 hypothetical protein NS346_04435 [Staphylococcus warneri]OIS42576.1 hypothetical protein A4A23_00755 [Staphylococcus warneri]OIS45252.1 hypothetical protein A4A24_08675 [Staphylococcus warneri]QNQ44296.1 hypothetical protein IAR39_10825 [Staphylococcus warneri]UGB05435.1 hypothetical protein LPC11_08340 [Staphylococcus sp. HL28]
MTNQLTVDQLEEIIRQQLLTAYHQYGLNMYLGWDMDNVLIEINTLEKIVNGICEAKDITKEQFILGGQ